MRNFQLADENETTKEQLDSSTNIGTTEQDGRFTRFLGDFFLEIFNARQSQG